MSEGYPDYARLSQAGGTQLFAGSGSIPQNTILFKGYVGPWPYVNLFSDPALGSENVTIVLVWFSDATFTTQVAFRYAVRNQFSIAGTQYANLSPWLQFYYVDISGNPISWTLLGLYGATGYATPNQLLSSDAPIQASNAVIAAGTSLTFNPQHVSHGAATLTVETTLATWFINLFYLTAQTYTLTFQHRISNVQNAGGGSYATPLLDAPYQITVHNSTAAAGNINWSLTLEN